MFEELFDKMFGKDKKKETKEDDLEMTFKPYTQSQSVEPQDTELKEIEAPAQSTQKTTDNSVELKVVRPESFSEVTNIADNLIAGCTVILNMEALEKNVTLKMLDFLNGVTYCLEGEIKKVAPSTYIITPRSDVDISDM